MMLDGMVAQASLPVIEEFTQEEQEAAAEIAGKGAGRMLLSNNVGGKEWEGEKAAAAAAVWSPPSASPEAGEVGAGGRVGAMSLTWSSAAAMVQAGIVYGSPLEEEETLSTRRASDDKRQTQQQTP